MTFNLTNLVMLPYSLAGKPFSPSNPQGGGSFMNLLMLQNLSSFWETYDAWQLASDAQGERLEEAPPIETTASVSKKKAKASPESPKAKEMLSLKESESTDLSVYQQKNRTFENTVKAVKSLQDIQEHRPLETLDPVRPSPSFHLEALTPQQQVWFQQWVQPFPHTTPPSIKKTTGLDEGRSLSGNLQKSLTEDPLNEVGQGKAPTATERMAFLKFLQAQMEEAHKKGKPFRVDVDSETSVVLSLKKDGVSATFLMKEVSPDRITQVHQQLKVLQESLQARQLPVKVLNVASESLRIKPTKVLEAMPFDQDSSKKKQSKSKQKS